MVRRVGRRWRGWRHRSRDHTSACGGGQRHRGRRHRSTACRGSSRRSDRGRRPGFRPRRSTAQVSRRHRRLRRDAARELGALDVLVTVVGGQLAFVPAAPIHEITDEDWALTGGRSSARLTRDPVCVLDADRESVGRQASDGPRSRQSLSRTGLSPAWPGWPMTDERRPLRDGARLTSVLVRGLVDAGEIPVREQVPATS